MTPGYTSPDGRVRLYQADALDVLPTIPRDSFAGIVTDPPYSSGGFTRADKNQTTAQKYTQAGQQKQWAEFVGDNRDVLSMAYWSDLWMRRAVDCLRPGGYFLAFTDWRQLPLTAHAIQAAGIVWRGLIAWDKGRGARAPHKGYFRHQCEYVTWGTLGPIAKLTHAGPFDGCMRESVKQSDKFHRTGKPTPVMDQLIEFAQPGESIADPFMGSGTTGVSAVRRGLGFVGCEITSENFDIACQRIEAAIAAEHPQP